MRCKTIAKTIAIIIALILTTSAVSASTTYGDARTFTDGVTKKLQQECPKDPRPNFSVLVFALICARTHERALDFSVKLYDFAIDEVKRCLSGTCRASNGNVQAVVLPDHLNTAYQEFVREYERLLRVYPALRR